MNVKLLICLIFPLVGVAQVQVGNDIDGEMPGDFSGSYVSVSQGGNVVAIGSAFNSGNGTNSGHVRVYQNISGSWIQIGQDIEGVSAGDALSRVSLSGEGNVLAVGAAPANNVNAIGYAKVYQLIGGTWVQKGQSIVGMTAGELLGTSISLSANGNIIAVGVPYYQSGMWKNLGKVRVFQYVSGQWLQIGNDIVGKYKGYNVGDHVHLSSNGNILAMTADYEPKVNNLLTDVLRVYQNNSGNWVQIGNDIVAESSVTSLSLASNGNVLSFGMPFAGPNSVNQTGAVKVYENISGNWMQKGQDIVAMNLNDYFGYGISLSGTGNIIAVGATRGGVSMQGYTKIFQDIAGNWTQIGNDILGENSLDYSGSGISLTAGGNRVVIGAMGNDGNGTNAGHVRVYDLSSTISTDNFVLNNFNIFPNPTSNILNLELKSGLTLEKVIIYNSLGQVIKTIYKEKIDIIDLSSGIYTVEILTDKGKASKKVIIK